MAGSGKPEPKPVDVWRHNLVSKRHIMRKDDPSYFYNEPRCLVSNANVRGFIVGTGDDIFTHLQPAVEAAESEVVFVTCFWAKSTSLEKLGNSLRKLSNKALSRDTNIRVRIGFSSRSLFQKLCQTSNISGRVYSQAEWTSKLGLPSASDLCGLDLEVKSIFVRPFSVMHPKFVIIDRKEVWLPSCNVSWEQWFEGCIVINGPIVSQFVSFWQHFWARTLRHYEGVYEDDVQHVRVAARHFESIRAGTSHSAVSLELQSLFSVFLPSPHRINPRFSLLPWLAAPPPPPTPRNEYLAALFQSASSSIFIQTPNFTSPPILSAVLEALMRGVHVTIVTSERLMVLEQLVTAGTTTSRSVKKLVKRYEQLKDFWSAQDEEIALQQPGRLTINFFQANIKGPGESLQSHLKLTIVDDDWVLLGSGNMDRASWFTSQELDVAFHSAELANKVKVMLNRCLADRVNAAYPL